MTELTFNAIFGDVIDYANTHTPNPGLATRFREMLLRSKDDIWSQYDGIKKHIKTHYMDRFPSLAS